jgi:2-polyprenyl-3-methyl-5-hydroxy-6-metoxy-1,4-benzoquinol methylase
VTSGIQDFRKYQEMGAYHWKASSDTPWWMRDVQSGARYSLAATLVAGRVPAGAKGLDVGCGDGVGLFELAQQGLSPLGMDGSPAGLEQARSHLHFRRLNTTLLRGNVTSLPILSGSLNYAMSLDVIEHLHKPALHVSELARVVNPTGVIVVTTPRALEITRDKYHVHEFTAVELRDLLTTYFRDVAVQTFNSARWSQVYRPTDSVRTIRRSSALIVRALSALGYNPFTKTFQDGTKGLDLIAIARGPR